VIISDLPVRLKVACGKIPEVFNAKRNEVVKILLNLGYPETNSVHGFSSAKAKAKSFVSCAIGKMDK
jgi:hypothetical protein